MFAAAPSMFAGPVRSSPSPQKTPTRPVRPVSAPPGPSKFRAHGRLTTADRASNFVAEELLDSDTSEDEDSEALSYFWHNLQRLQVHGIRERPDDIPEVVRYTDVGGAGISSALASYYTAQKLKGLRPKLRATSAWGDAPPAPGKSNGLAHGEGLSTSSSSRAAVQIALCQKGVIPHVPNCTTLELLLRDARQALQARTITSSSVAPSFRQLRPGESPPMRTHGGRCDGGPGLRLWRCPADVTLEVLCFIHADDVCALVLACKTTRGACSVHSSKAWYMVLPHLILSSKRCSSQLKKIWLPRTMWLEGRDLDKTACKQLFTGLECTGANAARALVTLDLRNTKLCSAVALVSVTRACRSLRCLDLSRTRLRDVGADHLLGGLVWDPLTGDHSPHATLRVLSLEDNRLTAAVGRRLARVVTDTQLEELLLGCNQLEDEGVEAIAEALAGKACNDSCLTTGRTRAALEDVRLTRLDVSRNHIGSSGLRAFIGSLSSNRTLRILEVGGNERIGPGIAASVECAASVAAGLQGAQGLKQIHLWKCGLDDAIATHLISESFPSSLAVVNLATNSFSATMKKLISEDCRGIIRL